MSVLIVDGLLNNRLMLKSILEAAGYTELLTAESIHEAFELLGTNNEADSVRKVDLILMDIFLPEMDGITACRRIKLTKGLQDIPIIMLMVKTGVEDLEAAFAAGATDYITKPLNPVELLARVHLALSLRREMECRNAREKLLGVMRQLEEANQTLLHLSFWDGVTSVANRRGFDESLDREWRRGVRYKTPLSLIMIDIDCFKAYNDNYSHMSGDDCLRRVAKVLSSKIRRPGDFVARYGGEEFVVILPATHAEGAAIVAETLRAGVEGLGIPHAYSQISDRVTISLGVASTFPKLESSPVTLITTADKALYQAKREGRNRVKILEVPQEDSESPYSRPQELGRPPVASGLA